MKDKKLKKLAGYLSENLNKPRKKKLSLSTNDCIEPSIDEGYRWCEYDESVTEKFVKLVNNLLKYPDNIMIEVTPSYISLTTDNIKEVKKKTFNSSGLRNKVSEDDSLRLSILKNKGFEINYGYRKMSRYMDPKIYDSLVDIIKERVKEINAENFNDIWETISKESGLLRDSNLDAILS